MKTHKNTQMLTVKKVAKIFDIKESTVRDWAKKGYLPAKKVGRNWYFNSDVINSIGSRNFIIYKGKEKSISI